MARQQTRNSTPRTRHTRPICPTIRILIDDVSTNTDPSTGISSTSTSTIIIRTDTPRYLIKRCPRLYNTIQRHNRANPAVRTTPGPSSTGINNLDVVPARHRADVMTERVVEVRMRSVKLSGDLGLIELVYLAGSSVGIAVAAVAHAAAVAAGGEAAESVCLLLL